MVRSTLILLAASAALMSQPALAAAANSSGNSLNAQACQKGGYKTLAPSTTPTVAFTSEGQCTSYAAKKGNTIGPLQTISAAQQVCESYGFVFYASGPPGPLVECDSAPGMPFTPEQISALTAAFSANPVCNPPGWGGPPYIYSDSYSSSIECGI